MLLVRQFCVEIGVYLVCCVEVGAVNNILMKEAGTFYLVDIE